MKLIVLALLTFLIAFPNLSIVGTSMPGLASGRDIDVYTQYPTPYGGQGRDMPSKPFRPMMEVFLYACVTYNLDPVAEKNVAFKIEHGEWNFIRAETTNSSGVAWITFKIPWPDTDPEARVLGIWNVTAKVDIRDEVVIDTLWFYVMLTDLNCDGTVDGKDMSIVGSAFGTQEGQPRWNATADVNSDGEADGKDIAKVARDFGWSQ